MERYKAARASATLFMEDYPQSVYNEEMHYVRIHNSYELAVKSIFSLKKERLEEVLKFHRLFLQKYPESKFVKRVNKIEENTQKELNKVSETYAFRELESEFNKSQTSSKAKKIIYLKETIEKHRNFVAEFPESDYLKRVNDIKTKAEKELQKLQ